ncbi:MAG: response regulator [Rhodospirillales bacterium]|nr:response regulator [Rhodospirillales bacterium]
MVEYNFQTLRILVVDPSEVLRSLLGTVLKGLGVGEVILCEDGASAIERLERESVDIVISEWMMEPLDGLMLLRWIRRHKDSPNRFLPFLMACAQLDKKRIAQAINMGANDLMAKPFTAAGLNRSLIALIERNPLFVRTKAYFGPDRRRKRVDFDGMERREIDEAGGEGGEEAWNAETPDIRFYRLPPVLRTRAMAKSPTANMADEEALIKAERDIKKWDEDYADWALTRVRLLWREYEAASKITGESDETAIPMKRIALIAREVGKEAEIFDYPLLADFARSLLSASHHTLGLSGKHMELVKTHIKAMEAVAKAKLTGDGGDAGREIVRALKEANRKVMGEPAKPPAPPQAAMKPTRSAAAAK